MIDHQNLDHQSFMIDCLAQDREAILLRIADGLEAQEGEILAENRADVQAAVHKIDEHLMKRLAMDTKQIKQLADGIRSIARQQEPIRKVGPMAWRSLGR